MCRLCSVGGLTAHHSCDNSLAIFSTQLFASPTRAQRLLPKMSWSCAPLNFQKLSQIVGPTGTIAAASRLGATTSWQPAGLSGTTVWQGCDGGFKGGEPRQHTSGGESRRGRDEPGRLRPLRCDARRNKTATTETTTKATSSVLSRMRKGGEKNKAFARAVCIICI